MLEEGDGLELAAALSRRDNDLEWPRQGHSAHSAPSIKALQDDSQPQMPSLLTWVAAFKFYCLPDPRLLVFVMELLLKLLARFSIELIIFGFFHLAFARLPLSTGLSFPGRIVALVCLLFSSSIFPIRVPNFTGLLTVGWSFRSSLDALRG